MGFSTRVGAVTPHRLKKRQLKHRTHRFRAQKGNMEVSREDRHTLAEDEQNRSGIWAVLCFISLSVPPAGESPP